VIKNSKPITTDNLKGRFCGQNADWSVDAWHYGPGVRPNMVSGDLYVYEDEMCEPVTFTIAVVHYNDWNGDTIITPITSEYHIIEDAHHDALAMVAKRHVQNSENTLQ